MDPRRAELYLRHIREGGAKIADFLTARPDIDPDFIEDLPARHEAELERHISDLKITQQIERDVLAIEEE
ncbi:hypothetical protein AWC05_00780 [Mycobacterium florentinum]|uniref:Uncharacterized protein n=2 Tax=Mycobacterium florentinum TaxID=292462 RepID=A0A1X1TYM4_MYCFL|nr:hypothetical protein AWC05_00780 [Mycobacterium florentinum]BBX78649.1 hypothetical protein MFLOJ_24360 [Mycobacterium florentinum]